MTSGTAANRRSRDPRSDAQTPVVEQSDQPARRTGASANVVIADSHRPFREGLRINLRPGFHVAGEASNVAELQALVARMEIDLILVDQDLPGGGLFAVIEAAPQAARIVAFAEGDPGNLVIHALQRGVSAYLLKSTPARSLGLILQAVMRGEPVVDQSFVKTLIAAVTNLASPPRMSSGGEPSLTPRERQVALLLGSDSSTREIAEALGVSDVTARRHISSLMRKLSVASRAAARDLIRG
jgi:DNA-binding NarL/FixJ family response regulator